MSHRAAEHRALILLRELKEEIAELKRRSTALSQLAVSEDYVDLLMVWTNEWTNIQQITKTWISVKLISLVLPLMIPLLASGQQFDKGTGHWHITHTHHTLDWTPPPFMTKQLNRFKYLGLNIDRELSFDQRITSVHNRSQQRLHIICKLRALSIAPTSSCYSTKE